MEKFISAAVSKSGKVDTSIVSNTIFCFGNSVLRAVHNSPSTSCVFITSRLMHIDKMILAKLGEFVEIEISQISVSVI